ncbi:aKG-HExxH-type peptide beta-hydroxylase [Oricola sp.]|uniref:aKG-HExxH-type peptide beta-hydroxylase n=1 Tax=Oricola sp. TaxID=1979950 RepID=UPI003BA8A2C6
MADIFTPSAENGRRSRRLIQARLAESVEHVLQQSRGKAGFDEARGEALIGLLRSERIAEPSVYSRYFRAVRTIEATNAEPPTANLGDVEAALAELLLEPIEASHGVAIRPLTSEEFPGDTERDTRDCFVSESLRDEEIVTVDEETGAELKSEIETALVLIAEHAPQSYAEFRETNTEIIVANGVASGDTKGFGACSSLERWGSLLINSRAIGGPLALSEALVHEGVHSFIFGSAPVDFHVRNSPEERRKSPLRKDPRPLDGIYHATFVLARMCFAMHEFAESTTLPAEMRKEAADRAESSRKLFWDGFDVLEEHADYTDFGREMMHSARDYIASLGERAVA